MPLSRFHTREPLDDLEEGVVSLAPATVFLQRRVERVHKRGPGERDVIAIGVVEHQAKVLLLKIDQEARTEIAGEHLRRVVLHRPRGARAPRNHLPGPLEIYALRFREYERFGDAEVVDRDGDLIRELAGLSRTVTADVDDGLPERLEKRHGAFRIIFFAADHDREPRFDRADLAAGHRRVERLEWRSIGGGALCDLAGGRRADRAHVDRQETGMSARRDAVRPEGHGLPGGRARPHGDDDVLALGDLARGAHHGRTEVLERLRASQRAIRHRDREACLHRVSRHRGAHDPEPDESDALHLEAGQFSMSSSRERNTLRSPASSDTRKVPSSVTSTFTEATRRSSVTWMNPAVRASSFAIA